MLEPSGHNAHTLESVVSVGQKQSSAGLTIALTALEIYGRADGLLRYLISKDADYRGPDFAPMDLRADVRDQEGRSYEATRGDNIESDGISTRGSLQVTVGPGARELTVEITAVLGPSSRGRRGDLGSREGRWTFRFPLDDASQGS